MVCGHVAQNATESWTGRDLFEDSYKYNLAVVSPSGRCISNTAEV